MTTFRIDADNNVTTLGASQQIEESGGESETFSSVQELTALAEKFLGSVRGPSVIVSLHTACPYHGIDTAPAAKYMTKSHVEAAIVQSR
jgi:hypothetical protein